MQSWRSSRDGDGRHILRCTVTDLYRSAKPLASTFAWCRVAACAARFTTRTDALAIADAYAEGDDDDLVADLALPGPEPGDVIYGDRTRWAADNEKWRRSAAKEEGALRR